MSIRRTEISPGYPVLEIGHPAATARVALHGAHLMEWTPAGHDPVLYLSPDAVYRAGKAIRGGIPVCWPWFGPHPDRTGLPAHGFARTRFWEPADSSENDAGVTLRLTLRDSPDSLTLWPHPFRLTLTLAVGASLRAALHMENTGPEPFTVTGALHTYLAAGDIAQVRASGLHGTEYLDTTGTPAVRRQDGDVIFDREVDRNYAAGREIVIHDAALRRRLTVRGAGSQCAVVWNPWIEKTKALTDLPDDAWRRFVCIETANAWHDRITLAPGAAHTLATEVLAARFGE